LKTDRHPRLDFPLFFCGTVKKLYHILLRMQKNTGGIAAGYMDDGGAGERAGPVGESAGASCLARNESADMGEKPEFTLQAFCFFV